MVPVWHHGGASGAAAGVAGPRGGTPQATGIMHYASCTSEAGSIISLDCAALLSSGASPAATMAVLHRALLAAALAAAALQVDAARKVRAPAARSRRSRLLRSVCGARASRHAALRSTSRLLSSSCMKAAQSAWSALAACCAASPRMRVRTPPAAFAAAACATRRTTAAPAPHR
jgi:hypothetical protein